MAGAAEETRPTPAGIRFVSVLVGMAPAPAVAGAWIAPEGGQTISTEIAGARDEIVYLESSVYLEAPADDDWAVVASSWVTQNDARVGVEALRWEAGLSAKRALMRAPGRVMGCASWGGLAIGPVR